MCAGERNNIVQFSFITASYTFVDFINYINVNCVTTCNDVPL